MDLARIFLALKLLLMVRLTVAQELIQRIAEEPEDKTVIIGQTVKLRCRVENQVGVVLWSKKGLFLGTERSLPAYPRYSMVGSSAEGEYHLEIKDVHLSDENTYQCQITATQDQPIKMSRVAKLTVLVPPSIPKILSDDQKILTGREGFPLTAKCQVQGGKPHATIEWAIASDKEAKSIVRSLPQETPTEVLSQNGLFDAQSTLQFIAQSADDHKYLVCLAKHQALENTAVASIPLRIKSKPKVNITINSSIDSLTENGFAILSCNVLNANMNMNTEKMNININNKKAIDEPVSESESNFNTNTVVVTQENNYSYKWFHNGRPINGATSRTLHIANLNRSNHHNSFYTCKVKNDVGEAEAVQKLEMRYAPYFKSVAQKLVVQDGETVSFSCIADSNPPPKQIKWTKVNNLDWIGFFGQNLTLEKVNYGNEGKYNCEVSTEFFPPIYQSYFLFIKGPPRVEISNTPDAIEGGSAKIYCKVTGYPKPPETNITWHKGGSLLNPALNHRFEVNYVRPNEDEVFSILIIKRAFLNDFDFYNCSASNEFGTFSASTKLIESTSFPMYIMVPGVVGGCVAILVIAVAIVWVNRKFLCRSKSSTHSDDQSDLTVKVEDLGNNPMSMGYFPNIYSSRPPETVELLGTKTYIPIPQDNPDFDALPAPPYHAFGMGNGTYINGASNYTPPMNGHVMRGGYLEDPSPHSPHHHPPSYSHLSVNNPLLDQYATFVPPPGHSINGHLGGDPGSRCFATFGRLPAADHHLQSPYLSSGIYLQPLETVPEVATPDAADDQNVHFNIPRCASQISTHV